MAYSRTQNVICFGDLKQAAIYFDRVVPLCFRQMRGKGGKSEKEYVPSYHHEKKIPKASEDGIIVEIPDEIPSVAFVDLIYGTDKKRTHSRFCKEFFDFFDLWQEFTKSVKQFRKNQAQSSKDDTYEDLALAYLNDEKDSSNISIRNKFTDFGKSFGIDDASILIANSRLTKYVNKSQYAALTLLNTPLIDTECAEWDQILELRLDEEAHKKLINFRLFFHDTYQGKPINYIEDDINKRLDGYRLVSKKHGFDLLVASLSTLLDSKNIQSVAAGSLAATLIGGPISGLSTAVLIELGGLSLEVAKKMHSLKNYKESHELAYVIETDNKLNNES